MFNWTRRNGSAPQLAEHERVEQAARHQVATLPTELVHVVGVRLWLR